MITEDQHKQIDKAIIANIAKKIAAGKTPTKAERELLDEHTAISKSERNRSWDSIRLFCDDVGVTREAVASLLRAHPEVKRGSRIYEKHIPEGWIEARANKEREEDLPEKERLERMRLQAQVEGIKAKNLRTAGAYYHEEEVSEIIWALLGPQRNWMQSVESEWPGMFPGMTADQIRSELQKRFDEFLQMQRAVADKLPPRRLPVDAAHYVNGTAAILPDMGNRETPERTGQDPDSTRAG